MEHINSIVDADGTPDITAHSYLGNSFQLDTDADHQYATIDGLQGCTVFIAYNHDWIYLAHLWEVPGFSAGPPLHPTMKFDTQVKGFLAGDANNEGHGPSLFDPTAAIQPFAGATVQVITVGARGGTASANYRSKIPVIEGLAGTLGGTPNPTVIYKRPDDQGDPVRVTLEYSHTSRRLRVLYSDDSGNNDGVFNGHQALNVIIP